MTHHYLLSCEGSQAGENAWVGVTMTVFFGSSHAEWSCWISHRSLIIKDLIQVIRLERSTHTWWTGKQGPRDDVGKSLTVLTRSNGEQRSPDLKFCLWFPNLLAGSALTLRDSHVVGDSGPPVDSCHLTALAKPSLISWICFMFWYWLYRFIWNLKDSFTEKSFVWQSKTSNETSYKISIDKFIKYQ